MPCCGLTQDEEKQCCACIALQLQCGILPCKCFDYDNDGQCWGCVLCQVQCDLCFIPRTALDIICCPFIPCCGWVFADMIEFIFCCKPGKESLDRRTEERKMRMESRGK